MTKTNRDIQVRRVFITTLVANLSVAGAKLIVGLLTQSVAMVADGVHSSLDAMSNIVGLIGSAVAARPPDKEHPYGHRRFEALASMVIGGFLLLTGWEIVKHSIERLTEGASPTITTINFVVMIATLLVNLAVATYEAAQARRLRSELLLADSEHTRSDIYVSLTVLASLVATRLGWNWVDSAAALVVVVLIGVAAWKIVSRAVDVLVDKAALDADLVKDVAIHVPSVERVMRVRSRGPQDDIHLELDVLVTAPTTADQGDAIANEIRSRLRDNFAGLSDIQIYFIPHRDGPPDYSQIARAEGDALGLGVHEVIPITGQNGLILDMHVEVEPQQTIGEAHKLVSIFERRLKETVPEIERIVTHIEPAHSQQEPPNQGNTEHHLAQKVIEIAQGVYPDNYWHDLDIRAEPDGGFAVSVHCQVEKDMPLETAHRIAEVVETQVRAMLPLIHRVTIHTEPYNAID